MNEYDGKVESDFLRWFNEREKAGATWLRPKAFNAPAAAACDAYKAAHAAQQAVIDRLMLEHCPDEMTDEQRARWAAAQKPAGPEASAAIDKAAGVRRDGHSALRARNGAIESFDPHPPAVKARTVNVPRRFLIDLLMAIDFHKGHGTPSVDRVRAILLVEDACSMLIASERAALEAVNVPTLAAQRQAVSEWLSDLQDMQRQGRAIDWIALANNIAAAVVGAGKPVDLMQSLKERLPQGVPVAWRYRLRNAPSAPWRYVEAAYDVNQSPAYQVEPLFAQAPK